MRSATEQTRQALAMAREKGGKTGLNCIAELDPTALTQAEARDMEPSAKRGFLAGMPVLVKDKIDVKGLHTTAGSLALADHVAGKDAPIIRNLRKNGAVILGKSNMTEFANYTTEGMPGGYSSRGGSVIHAADPSLSPSGSSSGSAVAVAAGIVPAAVGTDTSFSIIGCAQENGICGLKPPAGSLPYEGIIPIARTLDSSGTLAQDFRGALLLYSAMRDEPLSPLEATPLKRLRIAVNTANQQMVSSGQLDFLRQTLEGLRTSGAGICELEQRPTPHQRTIMQWEFRPHLEDYLQTSSSGRKTLSEIVDYYEANPETMMKYGITLLKRSLEETPGGLAGGPYLTAMAERTKAIRMMREQLFGYDAVVMTGPTNIFHFCGLPSVTIAGKQTTQHGVRRGLILYGPEEEKLYRAALALEAILP